MISLANGCVCCTVRDDLIESVVGTALSADLLELGLTDRAAVEQLLRMHN